MRLGLREANQYFSKAIKAVRNGEAVILTDRGRPIAVITPLDERAGPHAALRAMADQGLIALATRSGPMPPPRWHPARVKGRPVSQTIIEDRDDHG